MTQIILRRCYFPSTHADGAPLLPHTGACGAPFGWRSTAIAGLHASGAQLEAAEDEASSGTVNQNVDPASRTATRAYLSSPSSTMTATSWSALEYLSALLR